MLASLPGYLLNYCLIKLKARLLSIDKRRAYSRGTTPVAPN